MTKNSVFRSATALLAAASLGLSMTAQAEGKYIMGTATTGGTYYPVGVAISRLHSLIPNFKSGQSKLKKFKRAANPRNSFASSLPNSSFSVA